MDIMTTVILLGIIQGILFSLALITLKRGNRIANRYLSLLVLSLALSLFTHILSNTKLYLTVPHLLMITHPLLFLFGPFLFFYTKALSEKGFHWKWNNSIHLAPFILLIIYYSITFYFKSGDYKIDFKEARLIHRGIMWSMITPLQMVQLFLYLFFVNRILKAHKINIKQRFSSLEKINLNWIHLIVILFTIGASVLSIILFIRILGFESFAMSYGRYIYASVLVVNIYIMGYRGIKQPEIFTGRDRNKPDAKYATSPLKKEKAQKIIRDLKRILIEEKPFTDSELTIQKLADILQIPAYQLSQAINEQLHQNFFDLINSFRIEEAKQLLVDPHKQNLSIIALAFEAGFHSKSAFNAAFKKYVRITPSEFRIANTRGH